MAGARSNPWREPDSVVATPATFLSIVMEVRCVNIITLIAQAQDVNTFVPVGISLLNLVFAVWVGWYMITKARPEERQAFTNALTNIGAKFDEMLKEQRADSITSLTDQRKDFVASLVDQRKDFVAAIEQLRADADLSVTRERESNHKLVARLENEILVMVNRIVDRVEQMAQRLEVIEARIEELRKEKL